MKILLDLRSIRQPESGDGQFSINLINSLSRIDVHNRYTLLLRPETEPFFRVKASNFKSKILSIKPHSATEQLLLPAIIRKEKADLFHSFTYAMPYWAGIPSIINIYDITHIHFRQNYPYALKLYYAIVVKRCAKKADRILTLSNYSKEDIASHLRVVKNKIKVIYCGRRFFAMDKAVVEKNLKKNYNLKNGFILYVGNMRPHKNVETLIRAFKKCLDKRADLELVVCGKKKFSFSEIAKKVNSLKLSKKVRFMDYIDDKMLPLLYNGASLLAFPSFYEGFGLPPVEAMSCGTPVVSSDAASLPEILGDAARFVNPCDAEGLSNAMMDILSDKNTTESLSRRGLERCKAFSWEKSAEELLDLYNDIKK